MTLATYLTRPGAKSLTALATEIGISKGRLSQLRTSQDWPPELALKVEQMTGGGVNASDICPVIAQARQTGAASDAPPQSRDGADDEAEVNA